MFIYVHFVLISPLFFRNKSNDRQRKSELKNYRNVRIDENSLFIYGKFERRLRFVRN